MHLLSFSPAVLLITTVISTPVQLAPTVQHLIEKRQIGSLGGILKGIMDQNQGSPAVPVSAPTVPGTPASLPSNDCSEALQKINDALDTSERFMKMSENKPTIRDIQAVLAILADSLDDDCKDSNDRRRSLGERDNGPLDFLGGSDDDSPIGLGIFGGPDDDDDESDSDSNDNDDEEMCESDSRGSGQCNDSSNHDEYNDSDESEDMSSAKPMPTNSGSMLENRASKCSECERQLYSIVRELQKILSLTGTGEDENVSQVVGSITSKTTSSVTLPVKTTMM